MGKNPFQEMEAELSGMGAPSRSASGQARWGRVLAAVLVLGCLAFAFAYYLPLRSAHEALTLRFVELQSQVNVATRSAEEAKSQAKALGEGKQALESQLDEAKRLDKGRVDATQALRTALESKLQKAISSDQAAVGSAGGQVVASLTLASLLSRGKLEVSPPGKLSLCNVASAASKHTLRVVVVADKKSIPPTLAGKLKTPLQFSVAAAEQVAETLLDKCAADPTKLSATGVPAEPASTSKLEGKKLGGARVELWIDAAP